MPAVEPSGADRDVDRVERDRLDLEDGAAGRLVDVDERGRLAELHDPRGSHQLGVQLLGSDAPGRRESSSASVASSSP